MGYLAAVLVAFVALIFLGIAWRFTKAAARLRDWDE